MSMKFEIEAMRRQPMIVGYVITNFSTGSYRFNRSIYSSVNAVDETFRVRTSSARERTE